MVIRRIKGDNYDLRVSIVDKNDEPVPLTGCTVFFTVKRSVKEPDSQALISVDVNTFTNPTLGQVEIPLNSTQTDIVGEFDYDVKIKDSNGVITSVCKDKIIFSDHVTIRTS